MDGRDLIYDWNTVDQPGEGRPVVELDDESLRDGIQSPSITDPPIEDKIRLLHLMVELGIQAADIGLPAAGARVTEDAAAMAKVIADEKLPIAPNCAGRTLVSDVEPIVEVSQAAGMQLEASLFIGSSPVRGFVEGWSLEKMLPRIEEAIRFAIDNGLTVMFVTEDTTRARPETLTKLYRTAIDAGANRICLADTVGFADPHGTRMLVKFAKNLVKESGKDVAIDWHGHCDRGLALANALAAAEAGANRLHGTGLGVGERCGNTPMELLLVNLKMAGYTDTDLTPLHEYCGLVSRAWRVPVSFLHPVVGRDAFRTCTGVHAAAVIKALKKGDQWLANRVYSAIPAEWVGRAQCIEIGPMSGASNVIHWLETRGIEYDDDLVATILKAAKESRHQMDDAEIERLVDNARV